MRNSGIFNAAVSSVIWQKFKLKPSIIIAQFDVWGVKSQAISLSSKCRENQDEMLQVCHYTLDAGTVSI